METGKTTDIHKVKRRWMALTFFGTLLTAAILFIPAGTIRWGMGWVYTLSLLVMGSASAVVLEPELLAERMFRTYTNQKKWDRWLFGLYGLITGIVVPLAAGIDFRFRWKPDPPSWLVIASIVVYSTGSLFELWAMYTNKYFSKVARIQKDRGQTIVTSGPYQWVRHPGYLSGILTLLATPLILGSVWGFLPAIIGASALVIRTALEDKMLIMELEHYIDYARRVRWRLLPGVW